jgi:SM-20-related protein
LKSIDEEQWINWVDTLSDHHYVVMDDILSPQDLNAFKSYFEEKREAEALKKAAIGTLNQKQVDQSIRGDQILWLKNQDTDARLTPFFQWAELLKNQLNRYCFLSLSGYEVHFAHYPVGTFYKRHLDQFQGRNNRLISMILYLNQDWETSHGGQLKIYLPDGEKTIDPVFGRMVLFKSDLLEHEVLMTHKDRFSITGWMLHKPAGLGFMEIGAN